MSKELSNNDNSLLNFIATAVEELRGQMAEMREKMATKEDIARL